MRHRVISHQSVGLGYNRVNQDRHAPTHVCSDKHHCGSLASFYWGPRVTTVGRASPPSRDDLLKLQPQQEASVVLHHRHLRAVRYYTRTFPVAQMEKNLPAMQRPRFDPWVRKIAWRREWQPSPVFLPGEFHGQRSLVSHSLWGCKKSDMTE